MFPDVEENHIMKQMQTENNGEAELETEGTGGIFFNNRSYYLYSILFFLPSFSWYNFVTPPTPLTHRPTKKKKKESSLATLTFIPSGCCMSHSLCLVFSFAWFNPNKLADKPQVVIIFGQLYD